MQVAFTLQMATYLVYVWIEQIFGATRRIAACIMQKKKKKNQRSRYLNKKFQADKTMQRGVNCDKNLCLAY